MQCLDSGLLGACVVVVVVVVAVVVVVVHSGAPITYQLIFFF